MHENTPYFILFFFATFRGGGGRPCPPVAPPLNSSICLCYSDFQKSHWITLFAMGETNAGFEIGQNLDQDSTYGRGKVSFRAALLRQRPFIVFIAWKCVIDSTVYSNDGNIMRLLYFWKSSIKRYIILYISAIIKALRSNLEWPKTCQSCFINYHYLL